MQINENESVSRFGTGAAFGIDAFSMGMEFNTGRQHKKNFNRLGKFYNIKERIDPQLDRPFHKTSGFNSLNSRDRLRTKQIWVNKNINQLELRNKSLKGTAKSYKKLNRMLGWTGVASIGYSLGEAIFSGVTSYESAQRSRRSANSAGYEESAYYDTRVAATMRQRALQVIHNSQLTNRAAFGNEASYMHN